MKWSGLFSKVAEVAESLFSEVEDFKKGKISVEIEGGQHKLIINFEKTLGGKLNAQFLIEPGEVTASIAESVETEKEAAVKEEPVKQEQSLGGVETTTSEQKVDESLKEITKPIEEHEREENEFLY